MWSKFTAALLQLSIGREVYNRFGLVEYACNMYGRLILIEYKCLAQRLNTQSHIGNEQWGHSVEIWVAAHVALHISLPLWQDVLVNENAELAGCSQ